MQTVDNSRPAPAAAFQGDDEVSIGSLLGQLADHKTTPLIFHYEGRAVRPGYHVTEVKAGNFSALDCGANFEAWTEIFVQLWDIDEGERQHMPAGKFSAIIGKVTEAVGLDYDAKLTFEVSDGVQPMQLHRAGSPRSEEDGIHVDLSPRPSSCKPRDRWLEAEKAPACCGPAESARCGAAVAAQ